MNWLRNLLRRKPTAAERLQAIVDATRNSHACYEYRIRRAAALRGIAKRKGQEA